ncbi:MAG TPA: hypothetical protein P5543_07325 [Planctomycetota bacterium]|nr:hypothetical protein [Planctomycetota bacterium]
MLWGGKVALGKSCSGEAKLLGGGKIARGKYSGQESYSGEWNLLWGKRVRKKCEIKCVEMRRNALDYDKIRKMR